MTKTRQITVTDLDSKLTNLTSHFTEELNRFKSELRQKVTEDADGEQVNNDLMQRFQEFEISVKDSVKNIQNELDIIRKNTDKVTKDMDHFLQSRNNNKFIIYGCPEMENENLLDDILNLLNEKLQVNSDKNDISNCYRLGAKTTFNVNSSKSKNDKPRPVLVEFTTGWKRNDCFNKKSNLRGSKFVLSEVLTTSRYKLLQETKKLFGNNCWVRNGKIVVNINNKKHYICQSDEINSLKSNS